MDRHTDKHTHMDITKNITSSAIYYNFPIVQGIGD